MADTSVDQSVEQLVVEELLENFDCQPVLFVGSGLSRRYIGTPDWKGTLKAVVEILPKGTADFEYLSQKYGSDLIAMGTEVSNLLFEWAWKGGKGSFPDEFYKGPQKSIFIKSVISQFLSELTPQHADNLPNDFADEFQALNAIRPHAIITTNYDNLLETIFSGYEGIIGQQVLRYNLNAFGEVYHIHGHVSDPKSIILTADDYKEWEFESKYFAAKLLTYFAEHPVIIIGYSLSDPNVRTVLEDIGAIVADDTGLIGNVLQIIYDEKLEGKSIQTEIAIPVNDSQFRIRAIQTKDFLPVFKALAAKHELKDVNPAMVRALAARVMQLTRSDIPNGNIEVDYHTLEGIIENDHALPALLGITHADDVNKSHPYTLSIIGHKLGYPGWNGAFKLLKSIKSDTGKDIKSSDNIYHCAIKVGQSANSISHKYSDALLSLLEKVRDGKSYSVKI